MPGFEGFYEGIASMAEDWDGENATLSSAELHRPHLALGRGRRRFAVGGPDASCALHLPGRSVYFSQRVSATRRRIATSSRRYGATPVSRIKTMLLMGRLRRMYREGVPVDEIARLYGDAR